MRRWRRLIYAVVALVLMVAVLGIWSATRSAEDEQAEQDQRTARSVAAESVQERVLERTLPVVGTLSAYEDATVSTKVAGRLRALDVDLGDRVESGGVIAKIDDRDYVLAVRQARARHEQAQARLGLGRDDEPYVPLDDLTQLTLVQRAQAQWTQAQRQLEQGVGLSEQGIAPGPQIESLEIAAEIARTEYDEALEEARHRVALLEEREADLELARQQLSDTEVTAPFDGVIEQRMAGRGEYLNEGDAIARLVRTDRLRVRVEVPERRAEVVELDQPLRFTVENNEREHEATVTRTSPRLDEQRRALTVEADVENPGSLRPGAFIRGRIIIADDEPALMAPKDAVTSFAGVDRVFIVNDGQAKARRVTVGRESEDWIEIVEGLDGDERVIREPGAIQDGDPVEVDGQAEAVDGDVSVE